jgi:nicotinamide-nucleotide amidase
MAEGALARSPADIALAVTGVLGPEADEDGNPVGLVCFCCASRNGKSTLLRENFGEQNPDGLRHKTVTVALDLLARTASASKEK